MQLESIRTLNYCQHLNRFDEFSSGMNVIVGANGSGKSNLLEALRYSVTGVNNNSGKLEDNVAQLGRSDERSLIETTLAHGNVRLKITRQLRPAGAKPKLEVFDRNTNGLISSVTGDAKVVSQIESYLGVSAEIINEMVIVAQDDIFGFLDMTPTKRLASFQRLFRTEAAIGIYNALVKKIGTFQIVQPATTVAACEAEIVRCRELVEAWTRHAAGLRAADVVQSERDRAVQIVGNYNAYESLRTQVETDVAEVGQLQEAVRVAWTAADMAEQGYRNAVATQDSFGDRVPAARTALANLTNYRNVEASRRKLSQDLATAQAGLAALAVPVRPAEYQEKIARDNAVEQASGLVHRLQSVAGGDLETVGLGLTNAMALQQLHKSKSPCKPPDYQDNDTRQAALLDARQAVTKTEQFVQLRLEPTRCCPLCESPISHDAIQRKQTELPTLRDTLTNVENRSRRSETYERDLAAYEQHLRTLNDAVTNWENRLIVARDDIPPAMEALANAKRIREISEQCEQQWSTYQQAKQSYDHTIASYQQQLSALPTLIAEQVDEQALTQLIADYDAVAAIVTKYDQEVKKAWPIHAQAKGELDQLQRTMATRQQQLHTAVSVSLAEKEQAEQRQVVLDQELTAINDANSNVALAQNSLANWEQQLATVQQQMAAAVVVQDKISRATSLAELFRDLPKMVAQRNLQRLQSTINSSLELFRSPFRVSPDAELTFTATFTDGRVQPADRLSIGQRVVLALAFRLAVNLLFAENVGMLVLDEPTAWLDENHIRGFEPVLSRLKTFSASRGLQVIMVTHETRLAPLFDRTIQL